MQASKNQAYKNAIKNLLLFYTIGCCRNAHTHAWTNTREKENRLNWTSAQNNNWNENKHMGE